jgi:hypothetical protein
MMGEGSLLEEANQRENVRAKTREQKHVVD